MPYRLDRLMHDAVPGLARASPPQGDDCVVEGLEVGVLVDEFALAHLAEQRHAGNRKSEQQKHVQRTHTAWSVLWVFPAV